VFSKGNELTMKSLASLVLMISASILPAACATDPTTSSAARAIIDQPCAADTDCPTGFECEIEVEHGVTTSFCQADDDDGTCPAGYELEVEHGQEYCKPHGGGGGSGSGGGSDDGSGGGGGGGGGSDDGAGHT
jgi:hypothetical protein